MTTNLPPIPTLEPITEMPVALDPSAWPAGTFPLKSNGPCKYDITFTMLPSGEWSAIDRETYDDDPEMRLHCIGVGKTKEDALSELIDKIAEAVLYETGPEHVREMLNCPREEPPEFGKSRAETYREEDDGRDE